MSYSSFAGPQRARRSTDSYVQYPSPQVQTEMAEQLNRLIQVLRSEFGVKSPMLQWGQTATLLPEIAADYPYFIGGLLAHDESHLRELAQANLYGLSFASHAIGFKSVLLFQNIPIIRCMPI